MRKEITMVDVPKIRGEHIKQPRSEAVRSWVALFEKEQADKKAELEAARLKADLKASKRKAKAGKA